MIANIVQEVQTNSKDRFEVLVMERAELAAGELEPVDPWAIRAVSGWGFPFISLKSGSVRLTEAHIGLFECMLHQTSHRSVPGILARGLIPGGPEKAGPAAQTHRQGT